MCIQMLNFYRQNLIALRRGKEADRLLTAEMRGVMRTDPGLGLEIYSEQIVDMFARATDKTEILSNYQDILRNSHSSLDECFKKIVQPLAKLYVADEDRRSAQKVVSMFLRIARDSSSKNAAEKLKETLAEMKPDTKKEE